MMRETFTPVTRNRLLCEGGSHCISYRRSKIYVHSTPASTPLAIYPLPSDRKTRLLSGVPLFERLLRLEPRCAAEILPDVFILSCRGGIYRFDVSAGSLAVEHRYRAGMNNPLSFSHIKDIPGFDDCWCYGEYWANGGGDEVSLYSRTNGNWLKAASFPKGTVKHIHAVVPDPYRQQVLVLTGDEDAASGIWYMKGGFHQPQPLLTGSQSFRASAAFPVKAGILYATDTPLTDNAIYLARPAGNRWTAEKLYEMPGPCIYGISRLESDGTLTCFLATSVEPDSRRKGWRYYLSGRPGPGVKDRFSHIIAGTESGSFQEIGRLKKDLLPMASFQFGNVLFPAQSCRDRIYAVPQSVRANRARTISLPVAADRR